MNDHPTSPTLSTRDPLRNGVGAAILTRLRDRMKIDAEFSEPGHASWKRHKARAELLRELIAEFEALS